MLTPEQIALLEKPFDYDEHGTDNNIYVLKSAIRRRLNEVDPGWELTPPELMRAEDNVVLMSGGLTVGGVTRYAVGTGIIARSRARRDGAPLSDFEQARNLSHAYKTAATDLLPRCALQFGVADYLRDMPRSISPGQFADWLVKISNQHWAHGSGGRTFQAHMRDLMLTWDEIREQLEPGITLTRLSDTSLTQAEALHRLEAIASERTG